MRKIKSTSEPKFTENDTFFDSREEKQKNKKKNKREFMITIREPYFSIEQICDSGQCFRMEKMEEGVYLIPAQNDCLTVTSNGQETFFHCSSQEYEQKWKHYFDLDTDYKIFAGKIPKEDDYLKKAAVFGSGIRILHQDLWEMIVSFLISQQNNIKRIRKCIRAVCETYGEKKEDAGGHIFYTFPSPEALALASEEELRALNLGYRSKYLVKTAKSVAEGQISLDVIRKMDYPHAREELLKLYGVGEKVADCICLFALHHLEAFPVDTHIRQVLERQYPQGFPFESFHGFEGVIQQYIFYYDLFQGQKPV